MTAQLLVEVENKLTRSVVPEKEMYFNESASPEFRPIINSNSQHLALKPIAARALTLHSAREQHVAELAAAMDRERKKDETFAPQINQTSKEMVTERVPLSARNTNAASQVKEHLKHEALEAELQTLQKKPTIDTRSKKLAEMAKEHGDDQADVKRKVRTLWADHAESTTMSAAGVRKVLKTLGLSTEEPMWFRFLAALGVDLAAARAPNGAILAVISYDRFLKVFSTLLKSATTPKPRTDPPPQPQAKPILPARTTPSKVAQPKAHQQSIPVERVEQTPTPSAKRVDQNTGVSVKPSSAKAGGVPPSLQESRPLSAPGFHDAIDRMKKARERVERERQEEQAAKELPPRHEHASEADPRCCAPGFHETVERLKKARATTKVKFEESLRGEQPLLPLPTGPTIPKLPFKMRAEERIARRKEHPILHVDVDMPNGRRGRVEVYADDTARGLAHGFAMSYGLDRTTESQLTALLQAKITEFTNKQQKLTQQRASPETSVPEMPRPITHAPSSSPQRKNESDPKSSVPTVAKTSHCQPRQKCYFDPANLDDASTKQNHTSDLALPDEWRAEPGAKQPVDLEEHGYAEEEAELEVEESNVAQLHRRNYSNVKAASPKAASPKKSHDHRPYTLRSPENGMPSPEPHSTAAKEGVRTMWL